jgi:hypothetical protein
VSVPEHVRTAGKSVMLRRTETGWERKTRSLVLAARFLRTRGLPTNGTDPFASEDKGEAERREAHHRSPHHPLRLPPSSGEKLPARGSVPLRTPSPFGAPTAALAEVFRPRLSFRLRFPVIRNGEKALLQTPLLASSSRTGRSAGEAGSKAARERFAKPRAGTAARSTPQIASRERPLVSELKRFYFVRRSEFKKFRRLEPTL